MYRQLILIPLNPKESTDSECSQNAQVRRNLLDFYEDWVKQAKEKAKHIDIAQELVKMLEKGLFQCQADVVFKVIVKLNIEYLLSGHDRLKLSEMIDTKAETASTRLAQLLKTVASLSTHLITIWNQLILPSEFQYFPEPLQKSMVAFNEENSKKRPTLFGLELLQFFQTKVTEFLEVEAKKQQIQQLIKSIPRNRNYRTVPCKTFHQPLKGGFCLKGEACNFIHCEDYRGAEVPREVLYKIRAENAQRYSTIMQHTHDSLKKLLPPGVQLNIPELGIGLPPVQLLPQGGMFMPQ